MTEQNIRVFNFEDIADEILEKEKLSLKWHSEIYELLFLDNGVRDTIQFRETCFLDNYQFPLKEFILGLQKYHNYQDNELIILIT